ncbi:hypothetical protein [Mycobacteroides abscessus]|uniref:hypothetical protein n=1 Tax=Mycobacteroides abscessus TaxID=36809 RepID=UPI000929E088|nr:hypothetical protein [Mycobacteroides abscessus]SHP98654.1 Uncharacterised protein [Mycobacteroides abscessus subsp. abscessus]SHQ61282.1 Uncharacterised protein [Mycobacteroides abscessus subsp. abscessus]SKD63282.1 Uncharacterised protein [Mycobacteroides abscessus subsp. abscessus]SLD63123.1 Uncharacterised protein [Mycobacteroides abscessus subsp. abscessus]
MTRSEPYFHTVAPVAHRLYVLTREGDIRRVTHLGIRANGTTVPITTDGGNFTYVNTAAHIGTWWQCHLAKRRGRTAPGEWPVGTDHNDLTGKDS